MLHQCYFPIEATACSSNVRILLLPKAQSLPSVNKLCTETVDHQEYLWLDVRLCDHNMPVNHVAENILGIMGLHQEKTPG